MKLMRVGPKGQENPAVFAPDNTIRDLSGLVEDISGDVLSADGLAKLGAVDLNSLPTILQRERIGACVGQVSLHWSELRGPRTGKQLADPRRTSDVYEGDKFNYRPK